MPLPKLEHSTYTLTIPSTGKTIDYRPYTVGEEKILLTALEGEDTSEITDALKRLIDVCCFGDFDTSKMTSYDIEYIFIKLRSQSVGNVIHMNFRNQTCPENDNKPCEKSLEIPIELDNAKVMIYDEKAEQWEPVDCHKHKLQEKIKLTPQVGVVIGHPSMGNIARLFKIEDEAEQRKMTVVYSIVNVYDSETVYSDFTEDELSEFVDGMPVAKKNEILEFVDKMPVLRYETYFTCGKCKYKEKLEFQGMKDFFE